MTQGVLQGGTTRRVIGNLPRGNRLGHVRGGGPLQYQAEGEKKKIKRKTNRVKNGNDNW